MRIVYSPQFVRRYKKLTMEVKHKAEKQEKLFRKNPFDERLKTHKLKGRLADFWAFSIDYSNRIILSLAKKEISTSTVSATMIFMNSI